MPGDFTVAELLRHQANSRENHPLLVCDHDRISYRDADRRSAELARGLIALGAGKGTHVGLLYPNGTEFVVGMLAAARIGAVVIPFSTFATARELREQLVDSDTEILLSAASFRSHDYVQRLSEVVADPDFDSGDGCSAPPRRNCATSESVTARPQRSAPAISSESIGWPPPSNPHCCARWKTR